MQTPFFSGALALTKQSLMNTLFLGQIYMTGKINIMIFKPQKEVNLSVIRVTASFQFMSNNIRQNLKEKWKKK